ncbi:phenylacetate--CoA ligase family protein [Rasiella sp. SM2506]|uniref:phenylacetate--CoA ligase family protein n=1 Tax=Rasiella sp. SM2506 TaxID=3423914 RepID=UPI003D78E2CE
MTKQLLFNLNIFDFTLRMKGFPIKEAQQRLREIQQISEAQYPDYLENARSEILQYHLQNNSFYKKFIGAKDVSAWENIPMLQKKDLQISLQERLSKNFSLKKIYTGKTSGSSGTPLQYAKDNFCHALTWAGIMDRFGWYGIDFNTSYQARFYGIPLEFKAYQKERMKDRFSNRYRFPIFDLSEKKLASFLEIFRKKKFDYLNGHTSSIVLFAKFLQKKKLILTEVCPTLKTCIVTSEMLFPDDKKLLESQLGIPVVNEYGASELDLLAFTNLEDDFQLNSDSVFIELVDEQGKAVPNGTPGTILVTMLYNKAHPFIRYEVGDLGIMDERSTFKKPILKQLIGRANDNATLANGTTVPGHTFYYVVKSAMRATSVVQEFIMEQNTLETFTFTYVAERDLNTAEINTLNESLYTYLGIAINLQCKRVALLDRSHRGKLKQFISHL